MELFQNKNKNKQKMAKYKRGEIFDTDKLQIDLGLWFGLIKRPNNISYGEWDNLVNGRLVNFVRENITKVEILDSIQERFLKLLEPIFSNEKVVLLFDYDSKSSFKCEFESGKIVEIKYYYGGLEEGPILIISDERQKAKYDYWPEGENRTARLVLNTLVTKLPEEQREVVQFFNEYSYYISVNDFNRSINISIDYAKDLELDEMIDKDVIFQSIAHLSLDASLDSVCTAVVNGIKVDPNTITGIKVEKKIKTKKNNYGPALQTQEKVEFSNGKIKSLILKKDGKTIRINDFSNWSYGSSAFTVSGDDSNKAYYVTVTADSNNLDEVIIPRTYVDKASSEVNKTLKFTLDSFKKK